MIQLVLSLLKDVKTAVAVALGMLCVALLINSSYLKDTLIEKEKLLSAAKLLNKDLKVYIEMQRHADNQVVIIEKAKDAIVEKTNKVIETVYVPKKEYITKFVKVKDETNCDASNRLFTNTEF